MSAKATRGTKILHIIQVLGGNDRLVAVIRHSERASFDNLPWQEWNDVDLTTRGTEEAIKFGKALGESKNVKLIQILSWGVKRCVETAEAIARGICDTGCEVMGPSSIALKSPIAEKEAYDESLHSCNWSKWNRMINAWLRDESAQTFLVPVRQYAKEMYRTLLSGEFCSPSKTTVIVTHDLYILPLARFFFPLSSSWLDFLNGVVLKTKGEKTRVGFDEAIVEFSHRDLFLE